MEPGIDAVALLLAVIRENQPENIWLGAPLAPFRQVENTNRGDIGEEFINRYLTQAGFVVVKSDNRAERLDLRIEQVSFEVKTASLGANGTFQFNHVRADREYRYLLCLGIGPEAIVCDAWPKAAVLSGQAGRLVPMAQDQRTTFKLTKRREELRPIETLPDWLRGELGEPQQLI